jgi:uncharacterized Zn-finger protein
MNKDKLSYNPITRKIGMILNNKTSVVCPHCQSGWVILSVGIHDHIVEKMAVCNIAEAKRAFYCPYCGKDMTEIFRWEELRNEL